MQKLFAAVVAKNFDSTFYIRLICFGAFIVLSVLLSVANKILNFRLNKRIAYSLDDTVLSHYGWDSLGRRADDLDKRFNISDEAEGKDIRLLSQGEKQRIAILRAVNHACGLLAADEPISALDIRHAKLAMELLLDHDTALLVTLHDGQYLPLFDRIIIMDHGSIVEDGSWEYIRSTNASKGGM